VYGTSGGPVLSDCMAQPSIWSSRSVKVLVLDAAPVSLESDMLVVMRVDVK
jgi:hypothetical protein